MLTQVLLGAYAGEAHDGSVENCGFSQNSVDAQCLQVQYFVYSKLVGAPSWTSRGIEVVVFGGIGTT